MLHGALDRGEGLRAGSIYVTFASKVIGVMAERLSVAFF